MRTVLTLAVLILLQIPMAAAAQQQEPRLMVVFDASGSMWGKLPGSSLTKFQLASAALRRWLPKVPGQVRSGLIGFGGGARGCGQVDYLAPLAKHDTERVVLPLGKWNPRGKGPIVGALARSGQTLVGNGPAVIIVIHDGADNCGGDPCAMARQLKKTIPGLKIHLAGVGLKSEAAEAMACVARETGGKQFNAAAAESVEPIIKQIVTLAAAQLLSASPRATRPRLKQGPRRAPRSQFAGQGLLATLGFAKSDLPLGIAMNWRLRAMSKASSKAAEANGGRVIATAKNSYLRVEPPPGKYIVDTWSGALKYSKAFEIKSGRGTHVKLKTESDIAAINVQAKVGKGQPLTPEAVVRLDPLGPAGSRSAQIYRLAELPILLRAGAYKVTVQDGQLKAQANVDLKAGQIANVPFALPGGRLKLIAKVAGPDANPANRSLLAGLRILLKEDSPDLRRQRREVARTAAAVSNWTLPAGTYYVTVQRGVWQATRRIVVTPGELTTVTLDLPLRRIKLSAVASSGTVDANTPFSWSISPLGLRGKGPLKRLFGQTVEVVLGHGRYQIESRIGKQNAAVSRVLEIAPDSAPLQLFRHNAGILRLTSNGSEASLGTTSIYWEVRPKTKRSGWGTGAKQPVMLLAPGTYDLIARIGRQVLRKTVTVVAGSKQAIAIDVP